MKDRSLTATNRGVATIPWRSIPHLNIPLTWFDHICFDDGKPHIQAMVVLADVVAWYQPRAIEDPESGAILGYERKFNGPRLQAYSAYFEKKFGISEKQLRGAKDRLLDIGVIIYEVVEKIEICDDNGTITWKYNVPFIDLNLPRLHQITVPKEWQNGGGGMSYRAQGYVLQGTGVCPTGHTTDITYTENNTSCKAGVIDETVSFSADSYPPDPFVGKTMAGFINQRASVIAAKSRKIMVESIGLQMAAFHQNTDRLADIYGKTAAIELMDSDNDLQKMQNMAVQLGRVKIDTVEKIDALLENWLKFAPLGKKAKKDGTPPIGSNLVDHASFLKGKGLLDDNGNITATVGAGNTLWATARRQQGGTECGDEIDYDQLAVTDVPEVQQPGLFG